MRRFVLALSVCSALVFTAQVADAKPKKVKLSLKEKRIVKKEMGQVEEALGELNKKCGAKIKLSMDWGSFKKADAINLTAGSPCESTMDSIKRVCSDADGKEAIQEGLKEIKCVWGPKDKANRTLEKGVLTETSWVKVGGGEYFTANPSVDRWLTENL